MFYRATEPCRDILYRALFFKGGKPWEMHVTEEKTFRGTHVLAAITTRTAGCILPLHPSATSSAATVAAVMTVQMNPAPVSRAG